jgi:hypothetical protein
MAAALALTGGGRRLPYIKLHRLLLKLNDAVQISRMFIFGEKTKLQG